MASPVVRVLRGQPRRRESDELVGAVSRIMAPRRRAAPPRRLRQRRHRRRLRPGPPVRRAGRRPGADRAHVPRRAPPARRAADPGRRRRRAAGRARRARAAAARRLRRDPRGHGRPAGGDPADRPAAARVPARPDRPVGQGGPGRATRPPSRTAGCSTRCAGCTSRTRCSGCAASGSAWSSPGCSTCRSGRSRTPRPTASRRAATRGPEVMIPLTASVQEMEIVREQAEKVLAEVAEETGVSVHTLIGTMIEVPRAALIAGRDRRVGRVLLVRHQRPDPDGLGLLPRRRRGRVLQPRTSSSASSASRRSRPSTPTASAG